MVVERGGAPVHPLGLPHLPRTCSRFGLASSAIPRCAVLPCRGPHLWSRPPHCESEREAGRQHPLAMRPGSATHCSVVGIIFFSQVICGPKILVTEIQQQILVAQSRQKSYADTMRQNLEFQVGDQVLLKVSPTKGVMRLGTKGKSNPRYIGPFPIMEHIGKLAYQLEFPKSMKGVHNVFHIFMLQTCLRDLEHHRTLTNNIEQDLTFKAHLVRTLDGSESVLRHRTLKYVELF